MDDNIEPLNSESQELTVDSGGKQWRTAKSKIMKLAEIMNQESIHPLNFSDEIYYAFDAAMTPEEVDFMLAMGGGNHTFEGLVKKTKLAESTVRRILDRLVYKGQIAIIKDERNKDVYHLMTIFPGWFELFLMRGEKTEETKLFAERIEALFEAAYRVGDREMVNEAMKDIGAHIKVLSIDPPTKKAKTTTKISVDKQLPNNENRIFATKSVTSIFEQLDEDETIAVGHCFCRFEKELVGDHCRTELPMETCISIGPGAEHVIKQGIGRRITKTEAQTMIRKFQDKGAIHQATRIIPLKDFQAKYPIDIFCNCCWDCCGIIGNYNRGYLPYFLKTYHRAVIANSENCTSCGECVKFCPIQAINLNESTQLAEVNDEICIGCGQCYHHCNFDVIELIEDERDLFLDILDKDKARITPKEFEEETTDLVIDESTPSDRSKVLEVLETTRQKFTREDNVRAFRKWNKVVQYYFTDLDEYFHFTLENGVPSAIAEGEVAKPDIAYTVSGTAFIGMMTGKIDAFTAFRKKLVKVKAPVKDLLKLQKLID